ncbi:MAG: hypothetical protein PHR30_00010 [Gallionellaceae bacterium]|nr:hypothetical protein [Gallionellaceae bacterium]MDD5363691.1 hypothetical protein [Gallionellaceae bacterium]
MEYLHNLDISWLALGSYAVIQTILLMVCDLDHFLPRWSLRIFLLAVTLQSLGIMLAAAPILIAAQFVSSAGIAWIVFGLVQDIKMHRKRHQN